MKIAPSIAVMPALILLLTWLSFRAINPAAERFDRALDELDHFSMLEASLQRDILSARTGELRNYDPLVAETNGIDASFDRLRQNLPRTAAYDPLFVQLNASVARQENLVEQFKSQNALLQNSLAYFALFSFNLSTTESSEPWVPMVSALAGAMLRLTLDTSPAAIDEVRSRLDALTAQTVESRHVGQVDALLAHGHLLLRILPATDRVLREFAVAAEKPYVRSLRATVMRQQSASRAAGRESRIALYSVSVLLAALVAHIGLLLQARAQALRRRAAFEHVIARISARLINTPPYELDTAINSALAEMAAQLGADRAYALVMGVSPRRYLWALDGISYPAGWPDQAAVVMAQHRQAMDGIVHIPRTARLPDGAAKDTLMSLGLQGWACVFRPAADSSNLLLGFDSVTCPSRITPAGELGLLRMAVDVIANALDRQSSEQKRERLEGRLQQARRLEVVGGLASGIAHNFNNIIAAILGYTEMADEEGIKSSVIAEIRRAAERARELIEQVLTFARRRDTQRAPVDIAALIDEAVSLLRASLPSTIDISVRGSDRPATVIGAQAQLQQVILNLCNNAALAMDLQGRIDIEITTSALTSDVQLSHGRLTPGDYVRIAVNDTGTGIEPSALGRIFEPFFTTRANGSGLGLATAREIVSEHNGAMNVQSQVGTGTRFEVWLPATTTTASRTQATGSATAPASDPAIEPFGHGETILLVENSPDRLLHDEEILAALGYEPVGFTNAEDAFAAVRAAPDRFDWAVVSYPYATELASAEILRKMAGGIPILLATTPSAEVDIDTLMASGISDVVPWPITSAEIAAALRNGLTKGRT